MTLNQKYALVCSSVTLNGLPAAIIGCSQEYAVIVSMDGVLRGTWSWQAVQSIVSNGGGFKL